MELLVQIAHLIHEFYLLSILMGKIIATNQKRKMYEKSTTKWNPEIKKLSLSQNEKYSYIF